MNIYSAELDSNNKVIGIKLNEGNDSVKEIPFDEHINGKLYQDSNKFYKININLINLIKTFKNNGGDLKKLLNELMIPLIMAPSTISQFLLIVNKTEEEIKKLDDEILPLLIPIIEKMTDNIEANDNSNILVTSPSNVVNTEGISNAPTDVDESTSQTKKEPKMTEKEVRELARFMHMTFIIPEKLLSVDNIRNNFLSKLNENDKEVFQYYLENIKEGKNLTKLIHNLVGFINYLVKCLFILIIQFDRGNFLNPEDFVSRNSHNIFKVLNENLPKNISSVGIIDSILELTKNLIVSVISFTNQNSISMYSQMSEEKNREKILEIAKDIRPHLYKFLNTFIKYGDCGFGIENHQILEIPELDKVCRTVEGFMNIKQVQEDKNIKNLVMVLGLVSLGLISRRILK